MRCKYLIDVNLPYKISVFNTNEFLHQRDLDPRWSDSQIWEYSKENDLTIITKDSDYRYRMLASSPPPKVVHIQLHNPTNRILKEILIDRWQDIEALLKKYKLITLYDDKADGIKLWTV